MEQPHKLRPNKPRDQVEFFQSFFLCEAECSRRQQLHSGVFVRYFSSKRFGQLRSISSYEGGSNGSNEGKSDEREKEKSSRKKAIKGTHN